MRLRSTHGGPRKARKRKKGQKTRTASPRKETTAVKMYIHPMGNLLSLGRPHVRKLQPPENE